MEGKGEMKKIPEIYGYGGPGGSHLLAGIASADYVQTWMDNGLYGNPPTLQTWDTAEAFLLSPGTWTGTGLTINSGLNHLNGLCS